MGARYFVDEASHNVAAAFDTDSGPVVRDPQNLVGPPKHHIQWSGGPINIQPSEL